MLLLRTAAALLALAGLAAAPDATGAARKVSSAFYYPFTFYIINIMHLSL